MFGPKLTRFQSVECLVIRDLESIDKSILRSLPELKELHYNRSIEDTFGDLRDDHKLDRIRAALSEFMDEVSLVKGADFQFTFADFPLTNTILAELDLGVQVIDELDSEYDVEYETVCDEYVYMKNYGRIRADAGFDLICCFDYTRLVSVPGEFPSSFFKRFTASEWIEATAKVQDADHFLWFTSGRLPFESGILRSLLVQLEI